MKSKRPIQQLNFNQISLHLAGYSSLYQPSLAIQVSLNITFRKLKYFFFNFRIVAGSLPYKSRNFGIKISHSCREISILSGGVFYFEPPCTSQSSIQPRIKVGAGHRHCTVVGPSNRHIIHTTVYMPYFQCWHGIINSNL